MPNQNCPKCKGLGGCPRCSECLNATPKTSPPPDYEGAVKVLECVASDYEYRAKIYGKQPSAECRNLARHEKSKAEACRAAIHALTPYLPKRCDWRGMGGGEGFLIKMRDGSQYLIPTAKFIEAEIADTLDVWNKKMEQTGGETPATPEQARKWAEDKFARPWHSADIDDLFAGTQWSEFADIAIKLPTEPLSPDDLWDETAEISFIPNMVKSP